MRPDLPEVDPPAFPPPWPAGETRYQPGDAVRVAMRDGPGHIRTPWYARGRTGRIERICGAFANPEELAFRRDGTPAVPLYRVRFSMAELWGDTAERSSDTVDIEIFEHWLEPTDAA